MEENGKYFMRKLDNKTKYFMLRLSEACMLRERAESEMREQLYDMREKESQKKSQTD